MTSVARRTNYYIDLRTAQQSDQISLDLSRHLLCRMTVGNVIIVADQPRIFCSVLCRRWKRIIQETELQLCLTLNRIKKRQLTEQLERLQALQFSSKASADCDVLVVSPLHITKNLPPCATLYVTDSVDPDTLLSLPVPYSLVVVYRPFWNGFIRALNTAIARRKSRM